MPQIQMKHIVSFTSEDTNFPAENLLKAETYRKWKCGTAGDKQAVVEIQLEKASKIHTIDIGNEGSAFVEVYVGRSNDKDADYQILLGASSFMSPSESKSATSSALNRVRMFGPGALSKAVAEQKWDRVKIICTQPYNKNLQYGLSFIKFNEQGESNTDPQSDSKQTLSKLGGFTVKQEDQDSTLAPGKLFAKHKEKTEQPPLTGPAAIRAASSLADIALSQASKENAISPAQSSLKRKLDDSSLVAVKSEPKLKYRAGSSSPALDRKALAPSKQLPSSSSDPEHAKLKLTSSRGSSTPPKRREPEKTKPSTKTKEENTASGGRHSSRRRDANRGKQVSFDSIMNGVVFVLSGFPNPYRGQLRDKALEMGATYRPDWDTGCTHLVCAFSNTPKYQQVFNQGGRIVSQEWIMDCFKNKCRYPWKAYRLVDPTDSSDSEDMTSPTRFQRTNRRPSPDKRKQESSESPANRQLPLPKEGDSDEYAASTDLESKDGDDDTDDEIRRFREKKARPPPAQAVAPPPVDDPYNMDTDVDDDPAKKKPDTTGIPLPTLPDFLSNKTFFLYGDYSSEVRRQVLRYVLAFGGSVEEYMGDKVNYVIAMTKWDKNFDQALTDNPKLTFVHPKWIFACSDQQRTIPHQPFIVTPPAR